MFEGLHAVDENDRNIPTVAAREFGVEVDVDFPERVSPFAACGTHRLFGLVAEVAAGSRVEYDLRFLRVAGLFGFVHFRRLCGSRHTKKYILPHGCEKSIKCEHARAVYYNFISSVALLSN